MLHHRAYFAFAVALAITLAVAANANAKDAGGSTSDITTTLNVMSQVSLAGHSLKPGIYTVKATDTNVTLQMNGKTVAEAPVEWKDSSNKPKNSNLLAESGAIKEIHFEGKTRYVVIAE